MGGPAGATALGAEMESLAIASKTGLEWAKYSHRVFIKSILGRPDGGAGLVGQNVRVGGWVKTGRVQDKGALTFLELNDGSCPANLQVIVEDSVASANQVSYAGTCLMVEGELKEPPASAKKQKVELKAQKILEIGSVNPAEYPIAKGRHKLETLRDWLHLRPRTNTISSVARIRNALAFATHTFFQRNGFLYVHTPIITTSDCEGAGEMFQVTTLLADSEKRFRELSRTPIPTQEMIDEAETKVNTVVDEVKALKAEKKSKEEIAQAVQKLQEAKGIRDSLLERRSLHLGVPRKQQGGGFDYSGDFFGRQAFLTVSGQLQVETYACTLSNVYTFGPTFRAENSHTSRHLAEFWMIEPELAFADIQDDMNCAEDYVKFLCQWLLDHCLDDMEFMTKNWDPTALDRLKHVATTPFARITYTEAIEKLQQVKDRTFENPVQWGIDLASEHERYLAEELFQKPVIVYNYPKDIKAFYMRVNDDGRTVAAMDLLVPKVGELVGGSQREERYEMLVDRLKEMELPTEPYEWYLDLRRYGSVKHSGFGLGFERMLLFVTGLENIRDVIPFPRYPGKAEF